MQENKNRKNLTTDDTECMDTLYIYVFTENKQKPTPSGKSNQYKTMQGSKVTNLGTWVLSH